MLRFVTLALFGSLAATFVNAGDTHPFTVHDMLAMDRISDARVSPDGSLVSFTLRTTDMEANRGRTDIWLAAVDGAWVRRLTTHESPDSQARWSPDGQALYFLSSRSGSQQVWRIPIDGGEARQVTDLPLDVDNLEVAPAGGRLLFSVAVFPGATAAETKAKLDHAESTKASGMAFDKLFVRHWDTWDNGTRNHVHAFDPGDGKLSDLMASMDADCPSRPFGGSEEFTVSPDGGTVVFTAKDAGREEAWSTDFNLYAVSIDGSAAPRKLTTNPAWDTQPSFSPDGARLAYLAMTRAGYEADRFDLVIRDWKTGREKRVVAARRRERAR